MSNKVSCSFIEQQKASLKATYQRIGETTTTVCLLTLPSGFSVALGKSACVCPSNYNFELGCKYALEDAMKQADSKLWELNGYKLSCELSNKEGV